MGIFSSETPPAPNVIPTHPPDPSQRRTQLVSLHVCSRSLTADCFLLRRTKEAVLGLFTTSAKHECGLKSSVSVAYLPLLSNSTIASYKQNILSWLHRTESLQQCGAGTRSLQQSKSNLASYIFTSVDQFVELTRSPHPCQAYSPKVTSST